MGQIIVCCSVITALNQELFSLITITGDLDLLHSFTGWAVSIGKAGFSATPGSKTPEPIVMKLGGRNYVGDPTLTSKYGSDRAAWGVSAHARNITVCDFLFSCFFFVFSSRLHVATVGRFSRKEVPFEISVMNFHIYPFYSPKFGNLHYGLWQRRTAITRASLKIEARCLYQSGGFRGRAI